MPTGVGTRNREAQRDFFSEPPVPSQADPQGSLSGIPTRGFTKEVYMTPELLQRRQEYEEKAHRAALNIRYAVNKDLAIRSFLRYLTLSIEPTAEVSHGR